MDIKCTSCGEPTPIEYIDTVNGKKICEGCAQSESDYKEYSDPLGMGYTNNPDYYG